jgi:hypothetical protein
MTHSSNVYVQVSNPARDAITLKIKELEALNQYNSERIDDLHKVLDLFPEPLPINTAITSIPTVLQPGYTSPQAGYISPQTVCYNPAMVTRAASGDK